MKKTVLVVGGSGFIGGAIAKALEEAGHRVISTSGSGKEGFLKLNAISDPDLADVLAGFAISGIKFDMIVYAVGDCPKGGFMSEINKPLTTIEPAELYKNLDLHVTGFLSVVQGLLPCMTDGSHIVVISSAVTRLNDAPAPPFLTVGHYAAAKSAQDALIGWLRKDANILGRGIKIHRLAPPAVDSPFHVGTPTQFAPPALLPASVIGIEVVRALYMKEGYLDIDFTPQK